MENQTFKLSKTGIIIIAICIVIVVLCYLIYRIANKKMQEISKEKQPEKDTENTNDTDTTETLPAATEKIQLAESQIIEVFNNYRDGKYKNSKEAIIASGLTNGSFYRRLNKYEKRCSQSNKQ